MGAEALSLIKGNISVDDRGSLRFVNDFNFQGVKRFYQVENFEVSTIRAFHGHMRESKYIYLASGSALVCAVPLDNNKTPSKTNKVERFVLSSMQPQLLFIPPAYANGFKVLEPQSKLIIFSTSTLQESQGDDFRFPFDYWGSEIWKTEFR